MASVEDFLRTPSEECLERCSREQLVEIAEYYELDVGDKRMKENIKAIVKANLFETGVLGPQLQVAGAGLDVLLREVGLAFGQRRELLLLGTGESENGTREIRCGAEAT